MLELLPQVDERIVALKLTGRVSAADIQQVLPEFDAAVAAVRGPLRAILDWSDLGGWESEIESLVFWARIQHQSTFDRVGIIAHAKWNSEISQLREILDCAVERFEPSNAATAWEWVSGSP
jgi:hypothetical protein